MPILSPEEIAELRKIPVRINPPIPLACGDCGARMRACVGKYGRFWGCTMYKETGCKGTLGADLKTGRPQGIPGDKATRAARAALIRNLDDLGLVRSMEEIAIERGDLNPFDPFENSPNMCRTWESVWKDLCKYVWARDPQGIGYLSKSECDAANQVIASGLNFSVATFWQRLIR